MKKLIGVFTALVFASTCHAGAVKFILKVDGKPPATVKAVVVISTPEWPPGWPEEFDIEEGFTLPDGADATVILKLIEPVDLEETIRELQVITGKRTEGR